MVSHIDIAIVIAYMFFCLVVGLLNYGKIKNIRDYTLGTKSFPTIVLMVTTLATTLGAEKVIGNVGKIHKLGLTYIIPLIFVPLPWFILAKIIAPNLQTFHKHKFISLSDIMEHWYGVLGRWCTNIISIFFAIGLTAMSTMVIGYLLHYFLGVSETIGMVIGLAVVTLYSVFGGISSVAFTDLFQALIFFVALPLACFKGLQSTGGIEAIWKSLPNKHTQIHDVPLFVSFILFALIPASGIPYIQRALIAKNEKQFLRSFTGVAILIIPVLVIVCLIGLITYGNNPNIESDKVLYYFINNHLSVGLKGLMIAGLLALIMSTQDSYLNTVSALLAHDVFKQKWSSLTDRQELLIARGSCLAISIASITIIFVGKGIMETIWLVVSFAYPLITIPLIAGLIGVRISKQSFVVLIISSLTTIIITRLFTGVFDTRSMSVGMIASAIVLYILHKRHKRESIFSLPKINVTQMFDNLSKRVLKNSYSIRSLYTVGMVLCINFLVGIFFANLYFFNPLNVSLGVMVFLLLMLLLNELWHFYLKRYLINIWRFCLILGLLFIPSYIFFVHDFHIFWLCNLILSAVLFIVVSDIIIGIAFIAIAVPLGYLLSQIFYSNGNLITIEFAIISCPAILIAISMQLYDRHTIAKTSHKEITYELKKIMQEKVMESLNIKEEFLNKLNHELRIPLSVMINTSDSIYEMWDKLSDKDKKKYLKDVVDNRKRFESYTLNILDLADLVQKRFKLNIKPNVNLVKLSEAAIDKATSLIVDANKNLKIKLEVKNAKMAIASCDEKRIQQVLSNLLSNAIKYSDHGIIKVLIKPAKDKIAISVSDEGVGIPKSEKSKIFTPFFESSRTKSSAEGKGLGLSIAQKIITLHHGIIKVKDNDSKHSGSIFTFILPCESEEVASEDGLATKRNLEEFKKAA
ncbi:MAG: hypothetical protein HRU36_01900 [Rickettsiales bacterium]|nr:hypothetical protein [Rickettsiales bacterium]